MNVFDTRQIAIHGLLLILSLFVAFHLLILLGIIPYGMVWGGRLKSPSEMVSFESISIVVNLALLAVVGISAGILRVRVNPMIIKAALWFMFALFLLNTLGNLLSVNDLEKFVFTPLTLCLSLFSLRLALDKKSTVL